MSCCKVDVKKEIKVGKTSYVSNIWKNFLTIISSILILTIAFPVLYLITLYFVITSTVTETDNSVGRMARILINSFKTLMAEVEGDDLEDDMGEEFEDFIKNPENYEIVGLEKDEEPKNKD